VTQIPWHRVVCLRRTRTLILPIYLSLALLMASCSDDDPASSHALAPATKIYGDALAPLMDRGNSEASRGNYALAAEKFRQALVIADQRQELPPATMERLLDGLGGAERDLEEREAATKTFQRLLTLRQKVYGAQSIQAALAMNEIGENYSLATDADNAALWLEKAKTILESHPEHEEADLALVLHNLASVHYYRDENAMARTLWERVLAIRTRLYGTDSSPVATTLYNLGWLADDDGRIGDARSAFERALAVYEMDKGKDHPDVALTLSALADLDCRDDAEADCTRAAARLRRAAGIQRRAYGSNHPVLTETLQSLASRYEMNGRAADALAVREELLVAAKAGGDKDDVDYAQKHVDELRAEISPRSATSTVEKSTDRVATHPKDAAHDAGDPFWERLPDLCAHLQEEGWNVPGDLAALSNNAAPAVSLPGGIFMCDVGKELPGEGPGRGPSLGALLTSSGNRDPSVIFTAHWFCANDESAALNQFSAELRAALSYASVRLPRPVADKMAAFEAFEATHSGILFEVVPQQIDSAACEKVEPGGLGAVHSTISVKLTPVALE
jgi:tetratricopeptide (TPR) repeat protein